MKKIIKLTRVVMFMLLCTLVLASCGKEINYSLTFNSMGVTTLNVERNEEVELLFICYNNEYTYNEAYQKASDLEKKGSSYTDYIITSNSIDKININIIGASSEDYFVFSELEYRDGKSYSYHELEFTGIPAGTYTAELSFEFEERQHLYTFTINVASSLSSAWTNSYPNGITLENYLYFTVSVFVDTLKGFDHVEIIRSNDYIVYVPDYDDINYSNNEIILTFYSYSDNKSVRACDVTFVVHTIYGETVNAGTIKFNITPIISYDTVVSDIANKIVTNGSYSDGEYSDFILVGNVSYMFSVTGRNADSFTVFALSIVDGTEAMVLLEIDSSSKVKISYKFRYSSISTYGTATKSKILFDKDYDYVVFDSYDGYSSLKAGDSELCASLSKLALMELENYCSSFSSSYPEDVLYYLGFTYM